MCGLGFIGSNGCCSTCQTVGVYNRINDDVFHLQVQKWGRPQTSHFNCENKYEISESSTLPFCRTVCKSFACGNPLISNFKRVGFQEAHPKKEWWRKKMVAFGNSFHPMFPLDLDGVSVKDTIIQAWLAPWQTLVNWRQIVGWQIPDQ